MGIQVLFLYSLMAGFLSCSVWLYQRSQRAEIQEKINRRWRSVADLDGGPSARARKPFHFAERLFRRAGIEDRDWHASVAIFVVLILFALGWKWYGFAGVLLFPFCAGVIFYLWLTWKAQRRNALVLIQLPLFLDQVLRALTTGRSMDGALALAAEESPSPLKEIIDRVVRLTSLGADLGSVLQETADLYRIKEWQLLALAVKINRTYGSSVRDLMESVINMIRQREASRREFKAMTGETRVSAWVLGLLPTIVALYFMAMNPTYLGGMLDDPSGKMILLAALVLQATGGFILWRMVKSI